MHEKIQTNKNSIYTNWTFREEKNLMGLKNIIANN